MRNIKISWHFDRCNWPNDGVRAVDHTCWLIRELTQERKDVWAVSRTLFLPSKIKPGARFFPPPDTTVKELVWKDLQKNI